MNMHELFRKHANALGIDDYGVFVKVCELLDAPARLEFRGRSSGNWHPYTDAVFRGSVAAMILVNNEWWPRNNVTNRVVLLDGTVIREWPAK